MSKFNIIIKLFSFFQELFVRVTRNKIHLNYRNTVTRAVIVNTLLIIPLVFFNGSYINRKNWRLLPYIFSSLLVSYFSFLKGTTLWALQKSIIKLNNYFKVWQINTIPKYIFFNIIRIAYLQNTVNNYEEVYDNYIFQYFLKIHYLILHCF